MKTQKISRVLKHFLLLGVFVFITITINALDYNIQNAPVTKATTICNAEVGMQVNVPITVTGFSNISAVSLTMIYDASKLRYVNFTKNPLLVGTCNVGDKDLLNGFHRLTLSWFKAQSPGITMEDGTPIVNYIFEFISGPATLEWADMGPSCEFVDPNGTILTDTPTSNFYVNGVISSSCQSIPTISPSGPTSFCEGGSVDLTASTGTAYLWSPGGETTQTITATTNGNFTVEVTNADGTKATSEPTVVTVSTLPAAPTASVTDQTSCTSPSGTIVITSPIEDGMTYSINGSDYYASLIFFGVVPGDYYVTAKNAAGCISQPSGKLTVNDQPTTPTVNINNPPAVCSPATVDLTVTSITTGSSPDLTFTYWEDVSATTAIQTPESVSGGLYYIKGTALSGCYDIEPVIVTVSGHPMINIHDPQEACSPSTVDLTSPNITWGSSSGLTYTYYKDADATTPVATPSQIAESGTYYIKGTLETGCFDIKAVQVVVNMNVPVSVSISPDNNNVCVGTSVTFTATPVGGGTTPHYLWYKGTIPVGDDQATYTYIPSDGDVISVELWSSEICATGNPATSEPITMLVKSLPLTPTAEATQPSCTVATGTIIVSSETEGLTFSIDGADYTNTTGMFTGLIPGDYFVTAQNAAGCISQPSVKLTIEAQSEMPSTPLISATGAIILCAGSSVLLTSSSSVGNQWYKDGLLIGNATSQTYLANTSGSYSVIVSSNGCLSAPAEAIVVTENLINSGEIAKGATNPGPGCGTLNPGLTANTSSATGSGAITYSWQQSDNEGINWTTIASATTDKYNPEAFTKTRWYKRIATSTLNSVECSAESNVLMYLVNPLPEVSSILPGGTTNVCVGSTLQFSNATIGGEWSSANDGIATVNSSGLVRGVSPGSVIISYTVTNENLCSKSGTKTVNVIALPVADILGSNSICIGKTTTLSPQGGGSWISNNPTVASVSSTGLVTGLTAGNATFTFTNGISPYCSATTLPVSVNDLPTANITNDNGLVLSCNIPSTTLTASGGISYLWSTGAQTEAIIVSTPGSYSVTATGNAGCVSAEASVTVSAQFDAPLAPTAEVTQPSCTVATGTISVTSDKIGLTFSIDGADYTNSTGMFTGLIPGDYFVTAQNAAGCISGQSAKLTINAQPLAPLAPTAEVTQPTCDVATGTISVTSDKIGLTFSIDGADYTNNTGMFTGLIPGDYFVTAQNAAGCVSAQSAKLTINAQPLAPAAPTAEVTQPNCTVATGTISVTSDKIGLTFSIDGADYTNSTGMFTGLIPGDYFVTAQNAAGCISEQSAKLTINGQPDAPLAPTAEVTQPSCIVATGTISVTSDKTDLSFSIDGLDYSNSSGIFSGLVAGEYFVTAQNADGCVSAQSDKLTIDAQPLAPAAPTAGVNPEFVIGSGQVVFSAITSAGSIKWYDAAFEGTEVQVLNPTISETTTYYAEAISPEGCISASRTAVTANVISSGTTQLSYRFANPRIMNGSGFNRFEFDVQVKASSAGTTFRNGNVNIKFEPSTLSTNVGNWTASAVSDHTTVLEISGSTLNIELTEGITGTELTTDYQTLVTVSAIITDENGVAGIDFNEDNMNGQQFYKLSESPRYAIYFNPNLYDAADFVDTYVGRVYSENSALSLKSATMSTIWPGWTQIASLNWDSNENTSVWNGDAAIPGGVLAIASNLRIHIQATLAVPDNGEMTVAGDTEIKPANGLIFESDANGTGSFITNTSSGAGSAVAKRYMTTDAWHIVASSVSGQSILEFLNSNPSIATSEDDEVRGMMDYNPTLNDWNDYFTNASGGNLETGKGFSMRTNENTAVSFAGKLQSGNLSATGLTSAKWNCVGNPYSSAIAINANSSNGADDFLNVNAIVLQNLDPSYSAIYVWDRPDAFNGVWGEYTIISNTPEFGSDAAFDIQQGQAFMVKMNTSATNIDFNPDMQFHATILPLKSSKVIWPTIKLKVAGNSGKSSTIIAFNSRMTKGLDPTYDAGLLKGGSDLMVYSRLVEDNGIPFAIQALPTNEYDHLIIPIGVDFKTGGEVIFSSELIDLSSDCMAILEDKESKTFTDLSKKDYTTTIAANSSSTDRFQLHTSYLTTGTKEEFGTQRLSAYAIRNVEMIVNGKVSSEAIALVYDVLGKLIVTKELERGNRNSISLPSIRTGIYMLSVHDHGKVQGFKISVKE